MIIHLNAWQLIMLFMYTNPVYKEKKVLFGGWCLDRAHKIFI